MTEDVDQDDSLDLDRVRGGFHTYVGDRCICRYCGFDGSRSPEDWLQLQGDHLIPRKIAGENAEDPLNRVVACFYCNMVKRKFDPTLGATTKVANHKHQQELIERAREHIKECKRKSWAYGGGPEKSFELMMRWIKG